METSRTEEILKATINGTSYTAPPQSRIEALLIQLNGVIGKLESPMQIKGVVDSASDLPSDAEPGWVYFVGEEGDDDYDEYVYTDVSGWERIGSANINIDSELSTTSTNPVQNSAIATALAGKADTFTIDLTPTDGSLNPVSSDGVYDALANKIDISNLVTVTNTGDVYIGSQLIRKVLTQAEYDLLDPPDPKVDYLIVPAST
ncbi:MAG: hypothetical protein IKH78_08105 [Ruminococcus sp.]|nr:hypothetical protein [Ruminococcus sp.]